MTPFEFPEERDGAKCQKVCLIPVSVHIPAGVPALAANGRRLRDTFFNFVTKSKYNDSLV